MGWKQGEARWRFSVPFCKDSRRPIVERTVWSHVVVVIPPFEELCLRLLQCCEPLDVEAFVAESAVETLDKPVLHGPSRADEAELHTCFYRPHLHGTPGEFGSLCSLSSTVKSSLIHNSPFRQLYTDSGGCPRRNGSSLRACPTLPGAHSVLGFRHSGCDG